MKSLKKSQFLAAMYMVALRVNSSLETHLRHNPRDKDNLVWLEKFYAFTRLADDKLVEEGHGWILGKGYSKECPIAQAVLFLAWLERREDMVSMKEVAGNAIILLEYTEAAWEEYQTLLANYEEMKRGLVAGLHAIAAENSVRAGLQ